MKKTLFIAIAGMMLLSFTQCGGGKGSKEYRDLVKHINETEKLIKNAKSCEDMDKVTDYFYGMDEPEYAKEDQMTIEENKQLLEQIKKMDELFDEKKDKLCD